MKQEYKKVYIMTFGKMLLPDKKSENLKYKNVEIESAVKFIENRATSMILLLNI